MDKSQPESTLPYPPVGQASGPVSEETIARLTEAVHTVFAIESMTYAPSDQVTVRFDGVLQADSEQAYKQLEAAFAPLDHTPVFRQEDDAHTILAMRGRFSAKPWSVWPNVVLLVLTLLSTLSVGASIAMSQQNMFTPDTGIGDVYARLLMGWPYALAILLILGAHEMGHYIAARRNRVPASLPYFIPLPWPISFFGTLGAVIVQRAPARNAREAFDVGVAGPLAGMAFAVPILLIGLATSPVQPPPPETYMLEGNSILYALSKWAIFGRFLPDAQGYDVFINQLAQAGWTGLFVTGLNLIPVGQLDGGHVLYTLFGDRARRLYFPVIAIMAAMALLVSQAWLLWVLLLLIFGRIYVPPLDTITQVNTRRRWVAVLALVIFILVFVPNPIQIVEPQPFAPLVPSA